MKIFINPEIKKLCAVYVGIAAHLCLTLLFISPLSALLAAIAFLLIFSVFLSFTAKRYKRISALSSDIDRILSGDDTISIKSYNEGELSILESNIEKMFIQLRENRSILEKEKNFLADAIADISHQLKTPLTSINIVLSLIRTPGISEERHSELLRELSTLIEKVENLVLVLLKISKIDAGTVCFEARQCQLSHLVKKAAEPLMIPMDIKNQSLITSFPDISLCCDFTWCTEAFGNILKNCVEHTPDGGKITIEAVDTPIFTQIVIRDTGPGFQQNDLPHIFERFYKSTGSSQNSFGIGLNLAKAIISAQNGTITACNSQSGSAEFTIKFYKQII